MSLRCGISARLPRRGGGGGGLVNSPAPGKRKLGDKCRLSTCELWNQLSFRSSVPKDSVLVDNIAGTQPSVSLVVIARNRPIGQFYLVPEKFRSAK
jgi:hypothetical protein